MTNIESIPKSKDITWPTKFYKFKAMVFSSHRVQLWELKRKKTEHQRIGAFELQCWRSLLRVPWTARRSNKSILKEINPECSLQGLLLKLKLQYFGHLIWKADSLEKTLMVGKIEGKRRRVQQKMRWLDSIIDSMDINLSKLREIVEERGAWHAAVLGVSKSPAWLMDWTTRKGYERE